MDQKQNTSSYNNLKRPRPVSLSIYVPRVKPVAEISAPETNAMSYNHHRPLSPGGRRLANPGRASENTLTDPYYQPRHNSYVSPRSSGGVIPISTQTYVNVAPPTNSRPAERYDSYSGRPRRSSLVDTTRGATSSTTQLPTRSRPAVIQQDFARPASPQKFARDKDRYDYVTPASSQEPRTTTTTHKKLYSVDGDGSAKLVADVNMIGPGERLHKRRNSVDRSGYKPPVSTDRDREKERDRGRRGYHANGTHNTRPKEKSIDDDDAFSYTDPASMYRDTEPRWRETTRQRRGSMDRGGAISRERPVSMLDPALAAFGLRQAGKEVGPPPSTRGWDRINDIGRTRSVREEPRQVAQSPSRGRTYAEPGAYGDPRDQYYVPPRTSSTDPRTTIHNYDTSEYEDRREPRRPERRHSISRDGRMDQSVERRGFGIRADLRNESQSRHAGRDGRGSDESIEHTKYRDSGYGEPYRRETMTAPPLESYHYQDMSRHEQEKRDREAAQRLQHEEYSRVPGRSRGYSDSRDISREPTRRREEDRSYDKTPYSDYNPRDRDGDRERERERARQLEAPSDREKERHHHRRDTTDRDRDHSGRKGHSPKQSQESIKPGLAQAATGGLAGAATAFGLTGLLNKLSDKRDKEKDEYQERDRNDRAERSERKEREREREDREDRRSVEDRDYPRERRPGQASSDEPPYEREKEKNRHKDADRGLGFAFGGPEPPRSAPPTNAEWNQERPTQERNHERVGPRDSERDRDHFSKPAEPAPAQMPAPAIDADEDYRRRMEQVQRELGRASDERASDSDPDRERRRREREQRQRERDSRNNGRASSVGGESSFSEAPPHASLRRSFEHDSQSSYGANSTPTASTAPGLNRKPSILDRPMTSEPAQIIDNSLSERRENRVRIVDPPTEEEERRPKGILKKPTEKFPEDSNAVREGVAPLKDATKKGIPPGARWTKIDRRLVNPEALEASHERFEERLDCVIVLRVLTKEDIQKLADRTREIRDRRAEEDREERKAARKTNGRNRDRRERDEYEYSNSEDEFKEKPPKMLEAPTSAGAQSTADFNQRKYDREREREPEPSYMSGGLGRRDEPQVRY